MHLAVIGATGGVGRHLVDQALAAGHTVTAAVRNPRALPPGLPAVTVDLADPDMASLRTAVGDADAVMSCLGPRGRDDRGVLTPGTAALTAAMRATGRRRIVVVSGAGVSTVRTPSRPDAPRREPGAGWVNQFFSTPLARLVLGRHFVDVATMEDVLRASDLDWTSVRPPRLTDAPVTGRYRVAVERNVRRGFRLARADVAHLMLACLERPATVGTAISVAY